MRAVVEDIVGVALRTSGRLEVEAGDLGSDGERPNPSPACLDRLPEEVADRSDGVLGLPIDVRLANAADVRSRAKLTIDRRLCLEGMIWEEVECWWRGLRRLSEPGVC